MLFSFYLEKLYNPIKQLIPAKSDKAIDYIENILLKLNN